MGIRWWESDAALNGTAATKVEAENAMLLERIASLEQTVANVRLRT
jgi:hypothetical protein